MIEDLSQLRTEGVISVILLQKCQFFRIICRLLIFFDISNSFDNSNSMGKLIIFHSLVQVRHSLFYINCNRFIIINR